MLVVKNLPAKAGDRRDVGSNSGPQEDPLEKEMGPHSSILAWRTPRTEKPGGLQSIGWHRTGYSEAASHAAGQPAVYASLLFMQQYFQAGQNAQTLHAPDYETGPEL